jgi:polyhydroxyalkanoate synthesis regulator phasin
MQDELRRWAIVGSGIAELARNRAEVLLREVVADGEAGREGVSAVVRELLERTKDDREELARAMKTEIHNQMIGFGVATSDDVDRLRQVVERLERRISSLEEEVKKASPRKKAKAKATRATRSTSTRGGKKTATRKSTAGKSARKATGRQRATGGQQTARAEARRRASRREVDDSRTGGRSAASSGKSGPD